MSGSIEDKPNSSACILILISYQSNNHSYSHISDISYYGGWLYLGLDKVLSDK